MRSTSALGASSKRGAARATWLGMQGRKKKKCHPLGPCSKERGHLIAQWPARYINSTISLTTNTAHLISRTPLRPSSGQNHRSIPLAADSSGGDDGGGPAGAGADGGAAGLGGATTGSSSGARLGCGWILSISRFASSQASKFCGEGPKSAPDVWSYGG